VSDPPAAAFIERSTLLQEVSLAVRVHGLFYEPSRASNYDLVDDTFAGGSVSESCELSGEGRGRMKDEG
jgi:hypothetical protein